VISAFLTLLGCTSLYFAARAADDRKQARLDREAAARIHAETFEETRKRVLKPYSVAESPFAMLIQEHGKLVPLPLPRGAYPVFGRVPQGVA